jgi:cytochrome c oxidase assembly factor 6
VAPDRNAREICWESRDIFFECLDKNNILDAIKEDDKARRVCPKEVADYERDCARSWVGIHDFSVLRVEYADGKVFQIKYFKQKRVMEYDRDRTLQRIQQDDAKMVAKAKADRKGGSWFG